MLAIGSFKQPQLGKVLSRNSLQQTFMKRLTILFISSVGPDQFFQRTYEEVYAESESTSDDHTRAELSPVKEEVEPYFMNSHSSKEEINNSGSLIQVKLRLKAT